VFSLSETREPLKIIFAFALVGLAVAGLVYAYSAFSDFTRPMTSWDTAVILGSVIVCPPQLLFAWCIDCEVRGWDGFVMYSIIGMLNAFLYGAVGAWIVLRKTKH